MTTSAPIRKRRDLAGSLVAFVALVALSVVTVPGMGSATSPLGVAARASAQPAITFADLEFVPIPPHRAMDTRENRGGARFGPATSRTLPLDMVVPAGATGVALNVTATDSTGPTFVTVWPAGQSRPGSSNLNVSAGVTRPNAVLVGLGADRSISVYNNDGSVDLIVDVMGYFVGGFLGVAPTRLMDTREGRSGVPFGAGVAQSVRVAGVAGVPADAAAVALNVTAIDPTAATFLTVYPTGSARPPTSNLNAGPGGIVPNLVVSAVGADGSVSVYNDAGRADVVVDVMGYFRSGGTYLPIVPDRVLDTRSGSCGLRLGPGETRRVALGAGRTPGAVALNVTAVNASTSTFLTVFPAGQARPSTSNLNVRPGGPIPNFVMVGTGAANEIAVYNDTGTVDVIVDVFGSVDGVKRGEPPTTCSSAPAPAPPPAAWLTTMLQLVNQYRGANGVGPLQLCPALSNAAQDFANVMAATGHFGHVGPDGRRTADRARDAGYGSAMVGENIAAGQPTAEDVMRAWINSPIHSGILLDPRYTHFGAGQAGSPPAWVQLLGWDGIC
jgi:uncharacterized protein YkwD